MPDPKEKLIFVFDSNGVREFSFHDRLSLGLGEDPSIADVIIGLEKDSKVLGYFQSQDDTLTYINVNDDLDTWINHNHLEANKGVILRGNAHILLTKSQIKDDSDLASIFYTEDLDRVNLPWEILPIKELKNNKIASQLGLGESHISNEEIYIRHKNFAAYQKREVKQKPRAYQETLSIRIRERLGQEKGKVRRLLKDIHLDIKPKEMVLVVGGSGAGKTTFINAVSAYEKADADVLYKDYDLYEDSEEVRRLVRLVPQFDTLRDNDRVYHTLKDAALIQLPREQTSDKKKLNEKIASILKIFGLEKERDNFISKISGGQRKRLSIAVEYLAEPEIFFLDEPDSGLDAGSAESVMNKVREIVDEGKISIIISHSPDRSAHLYDKILVIAKDSTENCGQMVFYGSIEEAKGFFEVEKLEDIVKLVNDLEKADHFIDKFREYRKDVRTDG